MQHPHDEEPEIRKVHVRFQVEPPRAGCYCISLNSRTLVILLQVNLAFSDELEFVCEGYYETKYTSIFAWFLVLGVGHFVGYVV
jgi:hypothetical protein